MLDLLRLFTLERDVENKDFDNELLGLLFRHDYEAVIKNIQV